MSMSARLMRNGGMPCSSRYFVKSALGFASVLFRFRSKKFFTYCCRWSDTISIVSCWNNVSFGPSLMYENGVLIHTSCRAHSINCCLFSSITIKNLQLSCVKYTILL